MSDGATAASFADQTATFGIDESAPYFWTLLTAGRVFSGYSPGPPLDESVPKISPTPLLRIAAGGCRDGGCQCPHWGLVLKGKQTWRFADREEVFEAGDAFYVEPGHVPVFEAGTEMIQFSPTAEMKATDEAIRRFMEASA